MPVEWNGQLAEGAGAKPIFSIELRTLALGDGGDPVAFLIEGSHRVPAVSPRLPKKSVEEAAADAALAASIFHDGHYTVEALKRAINEESPVALRYERNET